METRPAGAEAEYKSGNANRLLLSDGSPTLQRQTKGRFWTIANSLALIYVLASIAFPIVLFAPVSGNIKGIYDKCDADGEFDYDAYDIDPDYTYHSKEIGYYYKSFVNLFSRPSIVTVTLAFGTYNFEQAKWIDLAWDIGVGRIGQMCLVSISYVVITRSMLRAMETTAVPHRLFSDISFLGPSSSITLWRVATVTPKSQLWKAWKGRLFVITLIMAYLIAFPTMVSAMTGYITTYSTRIEIEEASIDYYSDELPEVVLVIGNCSVFNMSNGCHITGNLSEGYEVVESGERFDAMVYISLSQAFDCESDPEAYSTCGTLDIGDKNVIIEPIDSMGITTPTMLSLFSYNKKVYGKQYIKENGQCQPGKEYHWGFSYQLLFIFAILNLLWAISLWSLWLSTRGEYHVQTRYGSYRAAVDLVAVARATLGDKVEDMSNAEIEKELEKKRTGIVRSDEGTGKLINWDWTLFYKKSEGGTMAASALVGTSRA
ncbi:hypothetical protein SLS55_003906 [Diplodia seriata]|uniref:Integral membrane protein n=1 Tax=Diplodia seriata TaxID=420778 RepID=A0ABR3CHW8_9PEZI